jgi:hypothetical protein
MAQVTVSADTANKSFSVAIDGVTIENVTDVTVYAQRDSNGNVTDLYCAAYTVEKNESGVTKRVSYHAEGSEIAQRAIASGEMVYEDVDGFIGIEGKGQAAEDIDKYLSSQKRGFLLGCGV